jgi:hypothetical protein
MPDGYRQADMAAEFIWSREKLREKASNVLLHHLPIWYGRARSKAAIQKFSPFTPSFIFLGMKQQVSNLYSKIHALSARQMMSGEYTKWLGAHIQDWQ